MNKGISWRRGHLFSTNKRLIIRAQLHWYSFCGENLKSMFFLLPLKMLPLVEPVPTQVKTAEKAL